MKLLLCLILASGGKNNRKENYARILKKYFYIKVFGCNIHKYKLQYTNQKLLATLKKTAHMAINSAQCLITATRF